MLKLPLIIYFLWGTLFNLFDLCFYLHKRYKKNIKFVVTEEEGYIHTKARIFKSLVVMLINIALLILIIKL